MTLSEISFASVQNAMASAYTRGNQQPAAHAIPKPEPLLVVAPVPEITVPVNPDHKGTLLSIRA